MFNRDNTRIIGREDFELRSNILEVINILKHECNVNLKGDAAGLAGAYGYHQSTLVCHVIASFYYADLISVISCTGFLVVFGFAYQFSSEGDRDAIETVVFPLLIIIYYCGF